MSVIRSIDVQCDLCPAWIEGCVDKDSHAARSNARTHGWVRRMGQDGHWRDLCPACWKKYDRKPISQPKRKD